MTLTLKLTEREAETLRALVTDRLTLATSLDASELVALNGLYLAYYEAWDREQARQTETEWPA